MKRNLCNLVAAGCALSLAAAAMLFSGCSQKVAAPDANVLATVGTTRITLDDFNREIAWRKQNERKIPGKEELLAEMISRELSLQKARSLGLEKDADLQRAYGDMLVAKVREKELSKAMASIQVSDAEARADYEKNISRYTEPAKARLAVIYMQTTRTTSDEKRAEIESRMSQVSELAKALPENTKGFGKLAIDFSDDQASRYRGGDIGWFDEGRTGYRWPDEILKTGFALKTGAFSDILKTATGYFLVTKLDSRDAVVTPFEKAQGMIRQKLLAEKRQQAERDFAQQLQNVAPVQKNDEALAKIDFPKTTVAETKELLPPALPRTQ
jgi:parvulin-like peptidyl-prolyl isomerase